jgi:sugar phosphate isomerase/epimerase
MLKIGSKIDEVRIDGSLAALCRDLEQYVAIGLKAAEIPVHGLDVIKKGLLDHKRLEEVREILGRFDLEYSVHAPNPLNLMEQKAPELHLSVFRASMEFAAAIRAKVVVYHAGRFIPEEAFPVTGGFRPSKEEASRLMGIEREYLIRLSDEYPEPPICVENARPYPYYSPYCYGEMIDRLKEQVEQVNRPNVRINLDVGHLYMAAHFYQFDPVHAARDIRCLVGHIHVHDNFGGAVYPHEKIQTHQIPFGRGDSHMPVGWGEIPLTWIPTLVF